MSANEQGGKLRQIGSACSTWTRIWFAAVHFLPLTLAFIIAAVLAYVGQMYELYVDEFERFYFPPAEQAHYWDFLQKYFALAAMVLLSVAIYMANRALGRFSIVNVFQEHHGENVDPRLALRVSYVGILAALLPWVGLLTGIGESMRRSMRYLETILGRGSEVEGVDDYFEGFRDSFSSVDLQHLEKLYSLLTPFQPYLDYLPHSQTGILALLLFVAIVALLPLPFAAFRLRRAFNALLGGIDSLIGRPVLRTRAKTKGTLIARVRDGVHKAELEIGPRYFWDPIGDFLVKVAAVFTIGSLVIPLPFYAASHHTTWTGYSPGSIWTPLRDYIVKSWRTDIVDPAKVPEAVGLWALAVIVAGVLGYSVHLLAKRYYPISVWPKLLGIVMLAIVVALTFSGFFEFEWAAISRALGPAAMAIIAMLVIFSMLAAIAAAAQETRVPLFVLIVLIGSVVVPKKLENGNWMLLCTFALIILLYMSWSKRRRVANLIMGLMLLVSVVGLHEHWSKVDLPMFARAEADTSSNPRPEAQETTKVDTQPQIEVAFENWLKARRQQPGVERSGRYPAFIFAVEGGGIYAAAAAVTLLDRMQQRCSNFAEHVFAVSGVSGGAVGATVFHRALDATGARVTGKPCQQPIAGKDREAGVTSAVSRIILDDHLSPLLGLLVPDILGTSADRAWGLEISLAKSLCEHLQGKRAGEECLTRNKKFVDHWDASLPAPALVLNTTWVSVGNRVVYAPFKVQQEQFSTLNGFAEGSGLQAHWKRRAEDVSLLQAAVDSARFPGIVPAYELKDNVAGTAQTKRWYFVDGGYVDASGAMTAQELYRSLSKKAEEEGVDLKVILLTSTQSDKNKAGKDSAELKDIVAPLKAVFSVRGLLSRNSARETISRVAEGEPDAARALSELRSPEQLPDKRFEETNTRATRHDWKISTIELNQEDLPLELGWKISGLTHDLVSLQLGHPELCAIARPAVLAPRNLEQYEKGRVASKVLEIQNQKEGKQERVKEERAEQDRLAYLEVARTIRANSCVLSSIEELLKDKVNATTVGKKPL